MRTPTAAGLMAGVLFLLLSAGATGIGGLDARPATNANLALDSSVLAASVSVSTLTPSGYVGSAFWGVNAAVYYTMNSSLTGYATQIPIHYYRFPGGRSADAYNLSSNTVYHDDGTKFNPPDSTQTFVSWCISVSCKAILGVPGEIDSPSTAAWYVHWVESTLHFHPAYWEIGNEPAQWIHYGKPWSQWKTTDATNATPGEYALLVHHYLAAMKKVDPNIQVLGLPGVGTGAWHESTWVYATVKENGNAIAGVSVHVYPAGHTNMMNGTLEQFYASLTSPGALTERIPLDRQAILQACSTCTNMKIFTTEIGSASVGGGVVGGNYGRYMAHFAQVPYIAAEVAQGLQLNLTSLDVYTFYSAYQGALINQTNYHPNPLYWFYRDIAPAIAPDVLPTKLVSPVFGLFASVSTNPSLNETTILLSNVNTTASLAVSLLGTGIPHVGNATAWTWTYKTWDPQYQTLSNGLPSSWTLPPKSIALLEITT
jgi:hypothetical protein